MKNNGIQTIGERARNPGRKMRQVLEEALVLERNRLIATIENIPVGIAVTDEKGGNIQCNALFDAVWGAGRPNPSSVSDYKKFKAWWADTGKPVVPSEWASAQVIRTRKPSVNQTMEIERFDGMRAWVINSAVPLFGAKGDLAGSVVAITDITGQRRAEESLKLANERLGLAQRCAGAGIWDWDIVTGKLDWSPDIFTIFGIDQSKAKPTFDTWHHALHPDDVEHAQALINDAIKNHTLLASEYRVIRSDGQVRWINALGSTLYNRRGQAVRMSGICIDITERKRTEEALRRSEERFRIVARATNDAIWDWDLAGNRVSWNQNIEVLFGYRLRTLETGSDWWDEKIHPEDRKRVVSSIDRSLKGGKSFWSQEYRFLRKDNSYAYILDRGYVVRDDNGKAVRMIGSMMDLSGHKHKETELQKLNRTLKALSKSSQAMMRASNESDYLAEVCRIVMHDCGYAMVWVGYAENDRLKSVRPVAQAGFEKGYLQKVSITWSDTPRGRGPTGTAIRTGKPVICKDMRTDPHFKPWRKEAIKRGYASSIVLPLITGGKAFGAVTVYSREADPFSEGEVALLSDLSDDLAYGIIAIRLRVERMRAEETLRQTSDYLESLFNYANAPIICWDFGFRITRFNHAFEKLTDYKAGEVVGRDLSMLFSKESKKESLNNIKRTLKGEYWEVVEIPILCKDGGIRTVLWNSANVYSKNGSLLATIAQGQDITARKKMAEALKKANNELESKISQRTEELMRVQNELGEKRRLSDIGTLAATVAHELRNPLAAVRMAAYNIKRKTQDHLLDKHLENIETKISESEQIINNLLFYSRLKEPAFEQVRLYAVLEECCTIMQERFSIPPEMIRKEFEAIKDTAIEADQLQLKEMFSNILNNAHDAVSSTGARIEIVGEIRDPGYVKITVKDHGVGIDEADLPRVFEPFFSTKAKGTGLGLAVCHQVAKLHHGSITIESTKGKGTSVSVTLPCARMSL